jgi:hypothetical protein
VEKFDNDDVNIYIDTAGIYHCFPKFSADCGAIRNEGLDGYCLPMELVCTVPFSEFQMLFEKDIEGYFVPRDLDRLLDAINDYNIKNEIRRITRLTNYESLSIVAIRKMDVNRKKVVKILNDLYLELLKEYRIVPIGSKEESLYDQLVLIEGLKEYFNDSSLNCENKREKEVL